MKKIIGISLIVIAIVMLLFLIPAIFIQPFSQCTVGYIQTLTDGTFLLEFSAYTILIILIGGLGIIILDEP